MPDLTLRMIGSDLASSAIKGVVGNIAGMANAVREFANDAVKDYAKSQAAIAQLRRVAGDATDVFVEQASEMQRTLGVSDDMVISMQKLALTFGAAKSQVEPTTRAVLDYAAATGKDAKQAMELLLRGVEAGNGELKKMGVSYEETGNKSKDLARATEALAKKFGGSAAADAQTLSGQIRIAEEALSDLKKGLGGFITQGLEAAGVVTKFNKVLGELAYLVGGEKKDLDEVNERTKARIALQEKLTKVNEYLAKGQFRKAGAPGTGMTEDQLRLEQMEIGFRLKALDLMKQEREEKMKPVPLSDEGTNELTAAARNAAHENAKEAQSKRAQEMADAASANAKAAASAAAEYEKEGANRLEEIRAQAAAEGAEALAQIHIAQRLAMAQQQDAMLKAEEDLWYNFGRTTAEELNKTREMFANAGSQIGVALVNSLGRELSQLAEGGEMDLGSFFGDLIATIGSVVGTVVGAVNPLLGAGIGAGAGLLGAGIKGATKKRHDGGWVDRYHGGGWVSGLAHNEVPAILLEEERVLGPQEIKNMGGRAGVDAAARGHGGGTGTVINVSVVDGENFRQFVEGKGGRAIYNANRVGRGMLPGLLGGG